MVDSEREAIRGRKKGKRVSEQERGRRGGREVRKNFPSANSIVPCSNLDYHRTIVGWAMTGF